MHELEVRAIGDEFALLLDEEALKLIGVSVGDSMLPLEDRDGLRLIPKDSEIGAAMVAAERAMKQFSGALKKLADSLNFNPPPRSSSAGCNSSRSC